MKYFLNQIFFLSIFFIASLNGFVWSDKFHQAIFSKSVDLGLDLESKNSQPLKSLPFNNNPLEVNLFIHGYPGEEKKIGPVLKDFGSVILPIKNKPEVEMVSKFDLDDLTGYGLNRYKKLFIDNYKWDDTSFFLVTKNFSVKADQLKQVAGDALTLFAEQFLSKLEGLDSIGPKKIGINLIGSSLGGVISIYIVGLLSIMTYDKSDLSYSYVRSFDKKLTKIADEVSHNSFVRKFVAGILSGEFFINTLFSIGTPVTKDRNLLANQYFWGSVINQHIHIFSKGDFVQRMEKFGVQSSRFLEGTKNLFSIESNHNKRYQFSLNLFYTDRNKLKNVHPGHGSYILFGGFTNLINFKNQILNRNLDPRFIYSLSMPGELIRWGKKDILLVKPHSAPAEIRILKLVEEEALKTQKKLAPKNVFSNKVSRNKIQPNIELNGLP